MQGTGIAGIQHYIFVVVPVVDFENEIYNIFKKKTSSEKGPKPPFFFLHFQLCLLLQIQTFYNINREKKVTMACL